MEVYCTRPGCSRPRNSFNDLDNVNTLKTVQQKYCTACGMPLILVGRYLPLRLLGQGGFGAAYLASDRYTPTLRQCVVKLFQPSGDLSADQLEIAQGLFNREAEVLEKLGNDHPQIPDLYAFFPLILPGGSPNKPDEFFYLVQEFIDGQNLEEELEQRGRFSEAEVREVLTEILGVLQFVHDREAIHRDIKLSNIMRDRNNGKLYLLDFGAVKLVTQGKPGPGGRSTGIYSMGFAPPEQMTGGTVYPATDLYALAVTCIVLLTGQQPDKLYDSYNNGWDWQKHAKASSSLTKVLEQMLQPSPKQRFQSAAAALAALNPARSTPSAPATPPSRQSSQPRRQPRRQPRAPASARPVATPPPQPATPATPPRRQPAPPPVPAKPSTVARKAKQSAQSSGSSFSLVKLLTSAAFVGFEAGAIYRLMLMLMSPPNPIVVLGTCLLVVAGLVAGQSTGWIEKTEKITFLVVTIGAVIGVAMWTGSMASLAGIFISSIFIMLFCVIFAILFRLILNLLP